MSLNLSENNFDIKRIDDEIERLEEKKIYITIKNKENIVKAERQKLIKIFPIISGLLNKFLKEMNSITFLNAAYFVVFNAEKKKNIIDMINKVDTELKFFDHECSQSIDKFDNECSTADINIEDLSPELQQRIKKFKAYRKKIIIGIQKLLEKERKVFNQLKNMFINTN